jgi:hypothetical protein
MRTLFGARGGTGSWEPLGPAAPEAAAGGLVLREGEARRRATVVRCGPSHHHRCQASREEVAQGPRQLGPAARRDRARRTLALGLRLDEDDQGFR